MMAITKQQNKRLSQYDRERLTKFAAKLVWESQDSAPVDAAYAAASEAIRAEVEKQFSPRDMRVLQKYEAATLDSCIYVSRGFGDRDRFCFRDADTAPSRPRHGGCGYRTFLLEAPAIASLDAFTDAQKAFDTAIATRLADYKALIATVSTFNEVADVWPEAEELRESIVGSGSSLVILNNEIVERIRNDAAARIEQAA